MWRLPVCDDPVGSGRLRQPAAGAGRRPRRARGGRSRGGGAAPRPRSRGRGGAARLLHRQEGRHAATASRSSTASDYRDLAAWNNLENPEQDRGRPATARGAAGRRRRWSSRLPCRRPVVVVTDAPSVGAESPAANTDNAQARAEGRQGALFRRRRWRRYAPWRAPPAPVAPATKPPEKPADKPATPAAAPAAAVPGERCHRLGLAGGRQGARRASSRAAPARQATRASTSPASIGEPVLAAAAGKVIYVGSGLRGYGNLVIVRHNADLPLGLRAQQQDPGQGRTRRSPRARRSPRSATPTPISRSCISRSGVRASRSIR